MTREEEIKTLAIQLYTNPEHCAGFEDKERAETAIEASIAFFEEFDRIFPPAHQRRAGEVHVGGDINPELANN